MKYKIVHDKPGRLRLRCGAGTFSEKESYGISALLESQHYVISADVSYINGSILVYYCEDGRSKVLSLIKQMNKEKLPRGKKTAFYVNKEIDRKFQYELIKMTVCRGVQKVFLPRPLRTLNTVRKSIKYLKRGLQSLKERRLNVDVLDAASITAAMLRNDFETSGSIMFLLRTSNMLEEYTRMRAENVLAQSLELNISTVWCVDGKTEFELPLAKVQLGDYIRVRTGQVIPLDGIVAGGEALVNESSMTGEGIPVHKREGSAVFAGTVLDEGSVVIEVTALPSDTRIHNIVKLIQESENLKAGIQSSAERIADSIVPFSFLGFMLTYGLTGNMTKALSVLMVDYSCAIKLTTPIAVISAMREAATKKIVVKGGKYLEAFAQADTIIFDKTGTLTAACPQVSEILAFEGYSETEVLRIAACLEEHFPHSVARAIVAHAQNNDILHSEEHAEVEYIVAHGIASQLYGQRALIGSEHFIFEDEGVEISEELKREIEKKAAGCSTIYLALGGKLIGVLCIEDPVREEAAETIEKLKKTGFTNIVMLTGDSENSAAAVSSRLGIDMYKAQVLPEDKHRIVEKFKANGHKVVMVGDGINDSPALAAADVSVAMSDASDIAREVADITFLSDSLKDLIMMRNLSRGLMKRIKRNYGVILSFNSMLLAMGLGGIITPAVSSFLHNSSTMVLSGLNLRSYLPVNSEEE